MEDRVQIGHVGRYWGDDFKSLPFVKQPVTDEEIQTWQSMGYDYVKSFTGAMYDSRNPMPDWFDRLERMFGLYKQSYTVYRMNTLEIMPVHSDHFMTYCRLNDCTPDQVWRIVLMLEDWKPGHYFEMDGVGYVNWKAGDWFKWRGDVPHAASNIGVDPRYTLQITGLSVFQGQLNHLFPKNIPGLESDHAHPLINLDIVPRITDKHYMVYMNNGYITELDNINHSEEVQQLLNDNGLHIYLYEPLSSYKAPWDKHTQVFYSEFESNVTPYDMQAEELDSIYVYARRNKLTNVTVHTCDYNVHEWYPDYTDLLNLVCDDLFLKTQKKIVGLNEKPDGQFIYNFICLNWRFTKHRQLVATFLAGEQGNLSWYFKSDFETLKKDLFFDVESWKDTHPNHYEKLLRGCDIVLEKSPFVVDKHPSDSTHVQGQVWPNVADIEPGSTPALFNRVSNNLSDRYYHSFIDIVNETRFAQPTANFSEKVFQPIQYLKPFILVAPPKTLEYVRSMGFKTFGEFWDESYDDELDHGERLAKIFTLIDQIFAMTNQEQRNLYEQMIPTLQYNLNRFKEIVE
jgi:hypothetical protein